MIYSLADGMKRIDVPANDTRNNLPIGTVLQLSGYDNPKFVIVANLGITPGFESYGTKYRTINLNDGSVCVRDTLGMRNIKDKQDNRIQMYFTDQVLSAEEIMDAYKFKNQQNQKRLAAQTAKDQTTAAEIDRFNREYAFLERKAGSKKSGYALGAANIRTELKKAFPDVKFSVRSEGYSMGCSINIGYTNGPTKEEVENITEKYCYGTFDAMTDCAGEKDENFTELFGGARFVFVNRETQG